MSRPASLQELVWSIADARRVAELPPQGSLLALLRGTLLWAVHCVSSGAADSAQRRPRPGRPVVAIWAAENGDIDGMGRLTAEDCLAVDWEV